MRIKRLVQAMSVSGLAALTMAGNAGAATVAYSSNGTGTGFVSSDGIDITSALMLASSNDPGQTALVFTPNASSTTGSPSGLTLGDFLFNCSACMAGTVADYNSLVPDIVVPDSTGVATGEFIDTPPGASVPGDSDTITVVWLGLGDHSALAGNFGSAVFDKPTTTMVPAASNSGDEDMTVRGQIISSSERATLPLVGSALIVFGFFGRKRLLRAK